VGELPRDVRLKIVEGMANELGKTFRPIAEPVWTAPALKPRRDPQIVCQPSTTNDTPSIFELLIER